jgi:hypothetical protein
MYCWSGQERVLELSFTKKLQHQNDLFEEYINYTLWSRIVTHATYISTTSFLFIKLINFIYFHCPIIQDQTVCHCMQIIAAICSYVSFCCCCCCCFQQCVENRLHFIGNIKNYMYEISLWSLHFHPVKNQRLQILSLMCMIYFSLIMHVQVITGILL